MAIYHLSVHVHSRSKGHSAVAAAAYRSGARLVDARTGEICDFTRRSGVEHSAIFLPSGAPSLGRQALWDAAESAESRKNSCVAREVIIALPAELDAKQRQALAERFTAYLVERHGFAADLAIHKPGRGDDRNHHAHILTSTRAIGPDGFGAKVRVLDAAATGSAEITAWREAWADLANHALEQASRSERIDHRSNQARGIDDLPTEHVGRGRGAAARRARNTEAQEVNNGLRQLLVERAQVEAQAKIDQATALARRRTEAEQTLERLPEAYKHLADEIQSITRRQREIKERQARALPRSMVVEAQVQLKPKHTDAVLSQSKLRQLHDQLEAKQRWWQRFARKNLEREIEEWIPLAERLRREYAETRSTAKAPVVEDLEREARVLRQELAQRQAQREALDLVGEKARQALGVDKSKEIGPVAPGGGHRLGPPKH